MGRVPFARVRTAFATKVAPVHEGLDGRPFEIETPDFYTAVLELQSGVVVRLTANFFVGKTTRQAGGLEFHGMKGAVVLGDFQQNHAEVSTGLFDTKLEAVPHVRPPFVGMDWARPLEDFALSRGSGRRPSVTGGHAAHVVEVLNAVVASAAKGEAVEIDSGFTPPGPMDWAR